MTYTEWFDAHIRKHRDIVNRLQAQKLSTEQIVAYFEFDNMVKMENGFCPLYATHTKCHNLPRLNCYWCACPHFRFNDNARADSGGIVCYSYCAINAPQGKSFRHDNSIHHDCSECMIPHDAKTIMKSFSVDWKETMSKCNTGITS